MQIGQYVECQVTDAVWVGNVIAIPRGAIAITEITAIHQSLFRRMTEIEIKFIYVRAASGECVPLQAVANVSEQTGRCVW